MRGLGVAALTAVFVIAVFALPTSAAPTNGLLVTPLHAVFTMTNSAAGNQVVAYERNSSGDLTWVGNFSTGGNGTGAGLASQGSIALTVGQRWLLAVDAGSNQVSVFGVSTSPSQPLLTLTSVVGSGGLDPVSVTVWDHTVYVLNDGSATSQGVIAGFHLSLTGVLHPLAGSSQALSTSSPTGAAQVSFNPTGTWLVVTEKGTNVIDAYAVNSMGVASAAVSTTSNGNTPYGFAFDPNGQVLVSEAVTGSLSSYTVAANGSLSTVSASVSDLQAAACWVVVTGDGHYAYTTNTHSGTISSYVVKTGGALVLLQAVGATTGAGPTDIALSSHSHFLYVYDAGAMNIQAYQVHSDGSLSWVQSVGGLPSGAQGLVAA